MFDDQSSAQLSATVFKKSSIGNLPLEPTRNGALKKVLIRHEDVSSRLMFLNEVYVSPGEIIGAHMHADMEEVFYFLAGEGIMQLDEETLQVISGDSIVVPIKVVHILENTGDIGMKYICFGVKVLPEEV
jgi:mannose-6-phosphate isomerase-like protein (cupin superfamily)